MVAIFLLVMSRISSLYWHGRFSIPNENPTQCMKGGSISITRSASLDDESCPHTILVSFIFYSVTRKIGGTIRYRIHEGY